MIEEEFMSKIDNVNFIKNYEFQDINGRLHPEYLYKYIKLFIDFKNFNILNYLKEEDVDFDLAKYILPKVNNVNKYRNLLCNTYDKLLYYFKFCSYTEEEVFSYYLELSIKNNLKPVDTELLKWYLVKNNITEETIKKLDLDYNMALLLCMHKIDVFNLYCEQNSNYTIEELKGLIDTYFDSKINSIKNLESSSIIFHDEELVRYLMDKKVNKAFDFYQEYCVKSGIKINEDLIKFAVDSGYLNIYPGFMTNSIIDYVIDKYVINNVTYEFLINYIIREKSDELTDKQILKLRYATDNPLVSDRVDKLFEKIDNATKKGEMSEELYLLQLMCGKQNKYDDKINTKYEYIKTFLEYNIFTGNNTVNDLINVYSLASVMGKVDKPLDAFLLQIAISKGFSVNRKTHINILTNRDLVYTYLKETKDIYIFDRYLQLGKDPDLELVKLAMENIDDISEPLYKNIFKNREFVKELICINPNIINEYYFINQDIDEELIISAINNGYQITFRSPIVIRQNLKYIKLCIENEILSVINYDMKDDIYTTLLGYQSSLMELRSLPVNEDKKLIKEIIDLCLSYRVDFSSVMFFDTYEFCEYILDNANYSLISIVDCYEHNLVKYNLNGKKPDFNLYLKQIYRNNSLNFHFNKLSKKENEILMLFSLYLETFNHRYISNVNQLSFYVTQDGFTNDFYNQFVTNEYSLMFSTLRHNADKIQDIPDFVVEFFMPYLEKEYSKDKIDYLLNEFGNNVLLFNFQSYIDLDIKVLKKIVNLFKIEPFGFSEFNDKIYDSLKQEQFKREYPEFSQIYANISQAVNVNDINEITKFKYLVKSILIDYRKNDEKINILELEIDNNIDKAIEKYREGDIETLHLICNKFIRLCREVYRKDRNDILKDLDFPYDEKDYKKKTTLYVLDEVNIYTLFDSDFTEEEIEMMKKIIRHDKSLTPADYKKYSSRLNEFYDAVNKNIVRGKKSGFDTLVDKEFEIKRKRELTPVSLDILNMMFKFDVNELIEVVSDDDVYNNLYYHLHYYKIPMIPNMDSFINNQLHIEGSFDFSNIWKFITFYKSFLLMQLSNINSSNKSNVNISNLKFSFADLFNYFVNINYEIKEYILLFGREDYDLIVTDPGSFPSSLSETKKLMGCAKYVSSLYTTGITIPSFDKNVTYNGKKINVIVGNRTNMCNLTHGERTDACMRAGGVGGSLYEFCLTSPNGFHIRFEEPDTHEYISRVSGFRNGNTVFLNQLRYSCNKDKYTSEELIEYLKIVANELIELSRDSKCPIENVCISKGYAMTLSKLTSTKLKIGNIKEGIGNFYSDIDSANSIILASSNNGSVNLDNTNVEVYKPVRDKVYGIEIGIDKLVSKINTVSASKSYLITNNIYNIKEIDYIVDGYVGTDFYVYIDEFNDIHYDYFDMVDYHDTYVSLDEMNKYKEILMKKYNVSEKRY